MSDKTFGWCFIGSGAIARRVMADFDKTEHCYLASAFSRKKSTAESLCDTFGGTAYDSVEEAINDPGVKAVYIATLNSQHMEHTLKAIDCGKPILCEKPFALNSAEAKKMLDYAEKKGVYLTEAMWMRHNPVISQVLAWLGDGKIGKIKMLSVDFSYKCTDTSTRMYDFSTGGGALLDVGVYTLALAQFVMGSKPTETQATSVFGETGIDVSTAVTYKYENGSITRLYSGFEVDGRNDALICGTDGMIRVSKFWESEHAELVTSSGTEAFDTDLGGEGYQYQFNAITNDILTGKAQNEFVTHEYTLEIMHQMDNIRKIIGLKYSQE